jgi:hypothetical protein
LPVVLIFIQIIIQSRAATARVLQINSKLCFLLLQARFVLRVTLAFDAKQMLTEEYKAEPQNQALLFTLASTGNRGSKGGTRGSKGRRYQVGQRPRRPERPERQL